jgi:phosphoribosylformylglycinamidine (FGAM) synthase-like amidotransferase family enzyme
MVWHKDDRPARGHRHRRHPRRVFLRRLPALRGHRGAIADLRAVVAHAGRGGYVLGICNGFQVLTETGLLPGALMRNAGLKFICKPVELTVATADSAFTAATTRAGITIPVAHHDGNYQPMPTLTRLRARTGSPSPMRQPNGSAADIAGVLSENRRVLGMMPHPERAADPAMAAPTGRQCSARSRGRWSPPDCGRPARV